MAATIDTIDAAALDETQKTLKALLGDAFPTLTLSRGSVLHALLVEPGSIVTELNNMNVETLRNSSSLLKISEDPALADDDIVAGVCSNLHITRDAGGKAQGQLTLIMTDQVPLIVGTGVPFVYSGSLLFYPTATFVGVVTENAVVDDTTRLVTQRSDGYWEMIIDIEAADVGSRYQLQSGTQLALDATLSDAVVDAVTTSDFTGGRDTETNADLVARAQQAISPMVLSGRSHIESLLMGQFESIIDIAVIGHGDSEMVRSSNNLFGGKHGGKVDLYVRTRVTPALVEVTKDATLLNAEAQTWQVTFDSTEASGVYMVEAVVHETESLYSVSSSSSSEQAATSLDVLTYVRQLDIERDGYIPELPRVADGTYSSFQTLTVTFVDPETGDAEAGATKAFKFYLWQMPDITSIQNFVSSDAVCNPTADYLVKAPMPVLCAVTLRIEQASELDAVDVDAVKTAVAARVNALRFSNKSLPVSVIVAAAYSAIPANAVVLMPIEVVGALRKPDDTVEWARGHDEITFAADYDLSVSENTIAYYLAPEAIDVVVTTRE